MKVEVDLTEYGVKAPKWYDPINPHVINASGGSGGSNDVELTWEEYEALSEEEKMSGTNYFITNIGNSKSLTKKVLAFKERPFSLNTDYSFSLSESFLNFDYISVELKNGAGLRSITTFPTQSYTTGTIEIYITAGVSSTFNGRADLFITNGVNAIYTIYENNGSMLTQYTDVLVTGYRYERVVVPNQMVNYSTV